MENKNFFNVMFGKTSGANKDLEYKLNEINVADNWNPQADNPKEMGGFNFSTEDKILRWLIRGDTLYHVEIPEDAEIIDCPSESSPHGVFRSNKIILSNPTPVTDDIAMQFYLNADLPEKSYYKALIGCAIRGYRNTCLQIIKDKVNKSNIHTVLKEVDDFVTPYQSNATATNGIEVYEEVMEWLKEIESDLLISRFVDKEPYIKDLSNDKIINLTGESGSGKSYFSTQYLKDNNYIIIDTDIVFSDKESSNKESVELRGIFIDKPKDYLFTNFDEFYLEVLDYFKNIDKTIVIDSAQFRNIKDYNILKGKVIVMRTAIETCFERALNRWKNNHDFNEEQYQKFVNKKQGMFTWYKSLNQFLVEVENLK